MESPLVNARNIGTLTVQRLIKFGPIIERRWHILANGAIKSQPFSAVSNFKKCSLYIKRAVWNVVHFANRSVLCVESDPVDGLSIWIFRLFVCHRVSWCFNFLFWCGLILFANGSSCVQTDGQKLTGWNRNMDRTLVSNCLCNIRKVFTVSLIFVCRECDCVQNVWNSDAIVNRWC